MTADDRLDGIIRELDAIGKQILEGAIPPATLERFRGALPQVLESFGIHAEVPIEQQIPPRLRDER